MNRTLIFISYLLCASAVIAQSPDPEKVVGAQSCQECHSKEFEAWKRSHHATTWTEMHRRDRAQEIVARLGLNETIKGNGLCQNCHYTSQKVGHAIAPISGVSCESCHGGAKEWLDVHYDFGGSGFTRATESPSNQRQRLIACDRSGMNRPDNLYAIAENCYSCHSVPNEELVNLGGHRAGSRLNLVSWTQGEVRHNFLNSPNGHNQAADLARQRVMLVVGELADLEAALRAVGLATTKGKYAKSMAKRVLRAKRNLKKMDSLVEIFELKQVLIIAEGAKLSLNNRKSLDFAASKVKSLAKQLAKRIDGNDLKPLDSLLPAKSAYKGSPYSPSSG